jgi:hypothetical protein
LLRILKFGQKSLVCLSSVVSRWSLAQDCDGDVHGQALGVPDHIRLLQMDGTVTDARLP